MAVLEDGFAANLAGGCFLRVEVRRELMMSCVD